MELTFTVTLEEANVLIAGLGELPAKVSSNLIIKLQQQAAPQLQQEADVAESVEAAE